MYCYFQVCKGRRHWRPQSLLWGVGPIADRPDVVLPDVWIEQVETLSVDKIVRPAMDVMWQAFGLERCEVFDGVPRAAP